MEQSSIRHFAAETIDKTLLSSEWRKWLRSVQLYLDAEEITDVVKKKNRLLHLGGPQLQEIAFELPGAIVDYDPDEENDVFKTLTDALTHHFSPKQNDCFERHVFRTLKPEEGEALSKFLLRCRTQANKCSFGNTAQEAREINIKDKLIDTWAPIELKRKLLEKESSLDEVVDQCVIYEKTKSQSSIMQNSESKEFPVNRISNSRKRPYREVTGNCSRCGMNHDENKNKLCPALSAKCHSCNRFGHYARKCLKKRSFQSSNSETKLRNRPSTSRVNQIDQDDADEDQSYNVQKLECFRIQNQINMNRDDVTQVSIGNVNVRMLIDSGASCNIINGQDWEKLIKNNAIMWNIQWQVISTIKPYGTNKPLDVKCMFTAPIAIEGHQESIDNFMVVEDGSVSLLGKRTATTLGILRIGLPEDVRHLELTNPFPKLRDIKIKLTVNPNIKPVQQPVRRIPIAVEAKVEQKLDEALAKGIIEKVIGPSPWISPMVIVFKQDGDIRICVDMRRANEAIARENFPFPTFDNLMTKLRGACYFSRLDLSNAYHQIELAEESRPITTFISHKGLFRYTRLMFGVNSAPEIFQKIFQTILAPCKNCLNYLDDIIVFGTTEVEHDDCLQVVLKTLKGYNVLLNDKKCQFKVQELTFLGHILTTSGIKPDPKKIEVARNFRPPSNKEEVRSFLGLVTYLGKFIPNLGDLTESLRSLTKKDTKFCWEPNHQLDFQKLKSALEQLPTLGYFDPKLRTQLIADASPVALGAILLQFDNENQPRAISFASKSLSPIERRYSQTEKESLALVWAVEKFYFYLAGLYFELITDHKPLEAIFKPDSKPPARIERWVLRLQAFRFKVVYRSGKSNIADPISRLCKLETDATFDEPNEHHVNHIITQAVPQALSISNLVTESKRDPEIIKILTKIADNSWETNDDSAFYPFRFELTSVGPILLRGNKIVIPKDLRQQVLTLGHEGHPGETVMKRRLRSKVWWPQIDREAEKHVRACRECLLVSQPNKPAPMHRTELPLGPWQYISLDYMTVQHDGDHLLVVIDYYSRYHETIFTKSMTSSTVIKALEGIFSRLGLPKKIKADNAANFNGKEFRSFCEINGIELTNSPPLWPQANGEVENINRSLKKRLQISYASNNPDYQKDIRTYTMMYNTTPHGTTGKSPSELLFGRRIRDKIPCLEDVITDNQDEEIHDRDRIKKEEGKRREDKRRGATLDQIKPGDRVIVKNSVFPNKLTPNFDKREHDVLQRNGNELTLLIDGNIVKRNVAHVKKIPEESTIVEDPITTPEHTTLTSSEPSAIDSGIPAGNSTPLPPLKLIRKGGMWRLTENNE